MASGLKLIGAEKDLGLIVQWRYSFVPAGSIVEPLTDAVFIDVGGRLSPGVVDHHHDGASGRSTAYLVTRHPGFVHEHLVGPWIAANRAARVSGRTWSPVICMHANPDFDAIATTVLVQSLVEQGELPKHWDALVRYADEVDMGYERPSLPEQRFELYPLILMLQNLAGLIRSGNAPAGTPTLTDLMQKLSSESGDVSDDYAMLSLGRHLVTEWLRYVDASSKNTDLPKPNRTTLESDPVAQALAQCLEQDVSRLASATSRYSYLGTVMVPSGGSQQIRLAAAVLPACECNQAACSCNFPPIACDKIYMRQGCAEANIRETPLTVIEKLRSSKKQTTPARHRWIISIDPQANHRGPPAALEGLGPSLEWAEQEKRRTNGVPASTHFGVTRFPEYPGVADPWYDGRGHQYTIVDAPKDGSVLSAAEVIGILKSEFWDPLYESAAAWCWNGETWQRLHEESPSARDQRLKRFLRDTSAMANGHYAMAIVRIHGGWSSARAAEAMRDFVSGNPQPVSLDSGRAYIGPRNALVLLAADAAATPPARTIGTLLSLHDELGHIEQEARSQGSEAVPSSGAKCRELRKQFINAISEYHARPNRVGETPDARAIRIAMEEVLRIDRRRESTGDLLQLLDDEEQEVSEWRLNRLGLILAIMGVMQTIIAAFEAVEASWAADLPEGRSRFHAVWANATFGVTAVFALFALTMVVPFFQRLYGRAPILGRFFPEHARVPVKKRRPT